MDSKLSLTKLTFLILALELLAAVAPRPASAFLANETKVSINTIPIIDNEYDHATYQTVWQQSEGILNVMNVDPATGDFLHDTRLVLDTGLPPITEVLQGTGIGNGPEWIWTDSGSQILYTKAVGPYQKDYEVYRAVQSATGWTVGPLPNASSVSFGPKGFAPMGTLAPLGATPRVSMVYHPPNSSYTAFAWRNLDDSEGASISIPGAPTNSGRWQVDDNNTFCYLQNRQAIPQVFIYSVATRLSKQITTDAFPKKDPFIIRVPEYNNQRAIFTVVNEKDIAFYLEDASGNWSFIKYIHPPTKLRRFRSVEPIVYNGQTYLDMVAENGDDKPSEIWIAGIRPDVPFYREVSNHLVSMERNDPEFLVTSKNGLIVYFTKHGAATVYRCLTGLGAPVDEVLTGTAGSDNIVGTSLSDRIVGYAGSDSLTGGPGADHFVMDQPTDGVDTVLDFEVGKDVIDLHLVLAKFGYAGSNPLADGYIRVQVSALNTDCVIRVDGDGNGTNKSGTQVFTIKGVTPAQMNVLSNFIF